MDLYKIVNTDNFDGDYPDEIFINLPATSRSNAEELAKCLNDIFCSGNYSSRYYKVVKSDYELQPGFEP